MDARHHARSRWQPRQAARIPAEQPRGGSSDHAGAALRIHAPAGRTLQQPARPGEERDGARERDVAAGQVAGKPANIIEKIVDGKIEKFYSTICLLEQAFIKNPEMSILDLVKSKIAELGENIIIRRFTRYSVGEEIA